MHFQCVGNKKSMHWCIFVKAFANKFFINVFCHFATSNLPFDLLKFHNFKFEAFSCSCLHSDAFHRFLPLCCV